MGVTGLWPILAPSARPTPLPTLNRKRLAVDASIWIYQFLKAVRDKEGNALPNSHIVGFFRRICKLLYFGIKPVFVFDGGAPILKRQTILGRKQRREGRREDAVRTAGKLLALQMKRMGEEKEKEKASQETHNRDFAEEESIPADQELVYADEIGLSTQERSEKRKFRKTDAYDLPALANGIEGMGQPNDPRIMSTEELEEYARQFSNGEDINLYDFSKIDFDGDFFMSLPAGDRYNILNAARLRSRLRMGLSKKQLEVMFPDRMAFSRFQIERVRERNELTQRLMNLNGMNADLVGVTGGRIAGEAGREYVLVKNDGVEGGWALGVVNTDKEKVGERNVPIDVDALGPQNSISSDIDDEDEFEDVPVVGLNRLPKISNVDHCNPLAPDVRHTVAQSLYSTVKEVSVEPDSLFVVDDSSRRRDDIDELDLNRAIAMSLQQEDEIYASVDDHVEKAIALSFQKNHKQYSATPETENSEDISLPKYQQKAVEAPRPLYEASGQVITRVVNNRAKAAIPKCKVIDNSSDSDDGVDFQATLALARKQKALQKKANPVVSTEKNPFGGILPFENLGSIFSKPTRKVSVVEPERVEDDLAGGFDNDLTDEKSPKPIPPWLASNDDIRSELQARRTIDRLLDKKDEGTVTVEFAGNLNQLRDIGPVIIDSSEGEGEEGVGILDNEFSNSKELIQNVRFKSPISRALLVPDDMSKHEPDQAKTIDTALDITDDTKFDQSKQPSSKNVASPNLTQAKSPTYASPETPPPKSLSSISSPLFEDVQIPGSTEIFPNNHSPTPHSDRLSDTSPANIYDSERAAINAGFDNASDPEDEELYAQLALEAEEHGRFASTLNNKSEIENQRDYESELKALRSQQKKDRRDADEVSQTMITECQALLRLFGLPYITAPMEAEAQCAELVRLGLVDGVVTDDCDIFLFGGTRVYKNMFNSNKFVECYLASDIEKELSLSREQLISIAHLLGSDYTEGLPGIGPVTALEIISEFPSIFDFASWWSIAQYSTEPEESTFRKKFRRRQAAKLFLPPGFPSQAVTAAYWQPQVDSDKEEFQWGVPDLERLREFLMSTIGWSRDKTDEVLVPVIRDMNRRAAEGTQSNITHFFAGALGTGVRGEVGVENASGGSKRMREAVSKLKAKKQVAVGPLDKTFGDEAREWVQRENDGKNKGSERQMARLAKKNRNKSGHKQSCTHVSNAEVSINSEHEQDQAKEQDGQNDASDESTNAGQKRKKRARTQRRTKLA